MMRRTLARTIASSSPAQGALRPFLLAVLTTITVPNVSFACGMYIPGPAEKLVAEAAEPSGEVVPTKVAPKLEAAFAAIDDAGLDELIGAKAAPSEEAAAEEAAAEEVAAEEAAAEEETAADGEEITADAAPQS